jgi:hypothetical protein
VSCADGDVGSSPAGVKKLRARTVAVLGLLSLLLAAAQRVSAQDSFAGGSNNSSPPESFNANDNGAPDNFSDSARYRPLPGYTNCGPWYNNYNNFVRAMTQHYGGFCEVRNGNQVWCHARIPGTCNADATGGRPDSPMLDTGVRYTPQCRSVCDRLAGRQPVTVPVQTDCAGSTAQDRSAVRRTGIEALDTLAAGGGQVDHLLNTFSLSVASSAAQLLNPQQFFNTQVANAKQLVDMLSLPNDQFLGKQQEQLFKVMDAAATDPSGTLGAVAAVTVLRGGATRGAVVCKVAVSVGAVTPGLQRLKTALDNLQRLKKAIDQAPKISLGSSMCHPVNPGGRKYGCLYRAIAVDKRVEKPRVPVNAEDFALVKGLDRPTPGPIAWVLLRTHFPKRLFKTLTDVENGAQAMGYPSEMTFEQVLANILETPDARGLLFMRPFGGKIAHVVNVANEGGTLKILDFDSSQANAAMKYLMQQTDINYRSLGQFWLFRTGGSDMLP